MAFPSCCPYLLERESSRLYQTSPVTGRQSTEHNVLHCWLTADRSARSLCWPRPSGLSAHCHFHSCVYSECYRSYNFSGYRYFMQWLFYWVNAWHFLFCNSVVVVVCVCHCASFTKKHFSEACAYIVLSSNASYNTEIKQEFSYRRDEHSAPRCWYLWYQLVVLSGEL